MQDPFDHSKDFICPAAAATPPNLKLRRLHVLRSQRTSEVQWAHLTALRGIGIKQYGQSLVEAAGAGLGVCIRLICLTSRKTATAMMMNFKMVLMKMP